MPGPQRKRLRVESFLDLEAEVDSNGSSDEDTGSEDGFVLHDEKLPINLRNQNVHALNKQDDSEEGRSLQREAEAILERHRARIANERETQGELDTEIPVIEGRDIWGSTEKPAETTGQIRAGRWVRVLSSGRYGGDLGLVVAVDESSDCAEVVMLPRIDLDASSSIPSPSLFDPEAIKNYAGARTVRLEGDCYIFRRKRYGKDGLLMETIKLARLSLSSDPPREVEMDLFEQSRNPQVLRAIKEELYRSYFKVDDRVEVVTGTFRGYVGWIKSMDAHTASVSFTMEDQDVDVPISELRKRFEKGDFVEVLRGAFVGVQGFVVDEFEHSLVIVEILAFESVDQSPCKEVVVAVDQVAWKAAVGRLAEARSIGPELSVPRDSRASAPQTGDPYRHMEVTIRKGPLKLHRGAVVGSFVGADMNTMVSVRTYTQAVNTTLPFNLEDLVETGTGLPLNKARWIPASVLRSVVQQAQKPLTTVTGTPMHTSPNDLQDPAWNPSLPSPMLSSATSLDVPSGRTSSVNSQVIPGQDVPKDGQWLLDPRLLHKRLDIVVTGTRKKIWRSGQYEDHRGFLVLTEVPKKNSTCVLVKLGFNQVKLKCPIEYLYPETTTELDRLVCHEDAVQIDMINCQRVVVIGPSWDGKMEFVGLFGYIVAASHSAYPLQPNQVCVFVYKDGQYLDCVYFHINSICRSHQEHIVWDGLHYQ